MSISAQKIERTIKALKNVELMGPRVVLLRNEADEKSKGGIIIPDEAKRRAANGVIVGLGQGYNAMLVEPGVRGMEPGRWVTFNSFDGVLHEFVIDDETYPLLCLHVGQVYFVVKEGVVDGLGY